MQTMAGVTLLDYKPDLGSQIIALSILHSRYCHIQNSLRHKRNECLVKQVRFEVKERGLSQSRVELG